MVVNQGRPSITRSIADAVTIKAGNVFFLAQPSGEVPLGGEHGYGLYYHDCRYLNGYRLRLAGSAPVALAGFTTGVGTAIFELSNPQIVMGDGEHLQAGDLGLTWKRTLESAQTRLDDRLEIKNYSQGRVSLPLALALESGFEDIFDVRGLLLERPGALHPPRWEHGALVFAYDGADGRLRRLTVQFSPEPDARDPGSVQYQLTLAPLEKQEISITLTITESPELDPVSLTERGEPSQAGFTGSPPVDLATSWCRSLPEISSDNQLLNQVLARSIIDLQSLRMSLRGDSFFAAGVPWFATLFGRDSLITALQMLPINAEIAAETLRLLAAYQARQSDAWRDAQPGKILHELRVGELATLNEIPHTPYYGSVDATPLFLVLLVDYVDWTADLGLFTELGQPIDLALGWIDHNGDADGDGYVDYQSASKKGLINQGWKDSGDSIVNADGSLAKPPIALVEVQGYVYRAKMGLANLYERTGQAGRAAGLRRAARALRARFNRDFWQEGLNTYALALQAGGKPAAVVSSNPGQALWSGIADPEKARRTAERLTAPDMFSGWGIRTLSSREKRYNPIGYHLGSVWPHDNALIAAGFRRYGFDRAARQVFQGILRAAMSFEEFRLPELFCGFAQEEYGVPVHYPIACHPQAWAAGSIPFLICTFLGLEPDALHNRLWIRRPTLPGFIHTLDVRGLRVGPSTLDLHYHLAADGGVVCEVGNIQGDLRVQVSGKVEDNE